MRSIFLMPSSELAGDAMRRVPLPLAEGIASTAIAVAPSAAAEEQ